jgi:hypothetical protein
MASSRPGVVGASIVTALSLAVVAIAAAAAAAIFARMFGRSAETDGFFAAYSVYVLMVLVATAARVVVLPPLVRAARQGTLATETAAYGISLAGVAVVLVFVSTFASVACAHLLTGALPNSAQQTAAHALVWLVPAGVMQLFVGLLASCLAVTDDYTTAAVALAAGAVVAVIVLAAVGHAHGPVALAWGLVAGATLSLGVLLVAALRRLRPHHSLGGLRLRPGRRLWEVLQGASVPLALQAQYVIAVRFASGLGLGRVTSFSYAYLLGASIVAVAASPFVLVSTVPLTRRGIDSRWAANHIVWSCWLALTLVPVAAGVFSLVGSRILRGVLGPAYGGETASSLGRLVVYLSPWMLVSVAVAVVLPLLFVVSRRRRLPLLGLAAVVVAVPIEWAGTEWFRLSGLAVGLAVATTAVLAALLVSLSRQTLVRVAGALTVPAVLNGGLALVSFLVAARFLPSILAAVAGALLYASLLAALRPRELRAAWRYMRTLD